MVLFYLIVYALYLLAMLIVGIVGAIVWVVGALVILLQHFAVFVDRKRRERQ